MLDGPSSFIEATRTRAAQTPQNRSLARSTYLFVGAILFLTVGSFFVLFFNKPE